MIDSQRGSLFHFCLENSKYDCFSYLMSRFHGYLVTLTSNHKVEKSHPLPMFSRKEMNENESIFPIEAADPKFSMDITSVQYKNSPISWCDLPLQKRRDIIGKDVLNHRNAKGYSILHLAAHLRLHTFLMILTSRLEKPILPPLDEATQVRGVEREDVLFDGFEFPLICVDVDLPLDNDLWSAVHISSYIGDAKSLQILINAGANVGKLTRFGQSPLHFASMHPLWDCLSNLTDPKLHMDLNAVDIYGNTPLHFLVCSLLSSTEKEREKIRSELYRYLDLGGTASLHHSNIYKASAVDLLRFAAKETKSPETSLLLPPSSSQSDSGYGGYVSPAKIGRHLIVLAIHFCQIFEVTFLTFPLESHSASYFGDLVEEIGKKYISFSPSDRRFHFQDIFDLTICSQLHLHALKHYRGIEGEKDEDPKERNAFFRTILESLSSQSESKLHVESDVNMCSHWRKSSHKVFDAERRFGNLLSLSGGNFADGNAEASVGHDEKKDIGERKEESKEEEEEGSNQIAPNSHSSVLATGRRKYLAILGDVTFLSLPLYREFLEYVSESYEVVFVVLGRVEYQKLSLDLVRETARWQSFGSIF